LKHSYEITAAFNGVISTGEFQNEKPFFSIKEIIETDIELTEQELRDRQGYLFKLCREQFKLSEQNSLAERVQKEREDIRLYPFSGTHYPSVTSVINWDIDFFTDKLKLAQYGARGSIIHKQIENYITTKKWKDAKDIPECYPDLVILNQGDLKLNYNDIDFVAFLEKYPIEFIWTEQVVVNEQYKYAGRADIKGKLDGKVSLFDIKTGVFDEYRHWQQLTAYKHTKGNDDVEQLVVIPLDGKTQQGYSKPKILTDMNKYWSLFLDNREKFRKRFSI
jgi:hypothetical protein